MVEARLRVNPSIVDVYCREEQCVGVSAGELERHRVELPECGLGKLTVRLPHAPPQPAREAMARCRLVGLVAAKLKHCKSELAMRRQCLPYLGRQLKLRIESGEVSERRN